MNFSALHIIFLIGYVTSQSTFAPLSSSGIKETTITSTLATSKISFDTLSPAAFRTTTTTPVECPTEIKEVCKNNAQCILVNNSYFYCLCSSGFTGPDCSTIMTTTIVTTTTATTTTITTTVTTTATVTTTFKTTTESKIACVNGMNICQNQGDCFIINNNFLICECKSGFYGKFCEFELTPSTEADKTTTTTTTIKTTTTTIKTTTTSDLIECPCKQWFMRYNRFNINKMHVWKGFYWKFL